jgi:hypothetical protein
VRDETEGLILFVLWDKHIHVERDERVRLEGEKVRVHA